MIRGFHMSSICQVPPVALEVSVFKMEGRDGEPPTWCLLKPKNWETMETNGMTIE